MHMCKQYSWLTQTKHWKDDMTSEAAVRCYLNMLAPYSTLYHDISHSAVSFSSPPDAGKCHEMTSTE